jgi:hypothetical protein
MFVCLVVSLCAGANLCPPSYAFASGGTGAATAELNIQPSLAGVPGNPDPSGTGFSRPSAPEHSVPDAPAAQVPVTEKGLPMAILKDQIPIWTSPAHIRTHDLIWLLPLGAAMGVTLTTDTDTMHAVSRDRTFNKDNVNASNILLGSEIAIPVGLYGTGLLKGNAHARETGILGGEALADGVIVEEVAKLIFRRERPLYNNAAGDFFASGVTTNGSFPSSHSTLAWTLAAVVAGEYPSKWVQLGVYSMASSVSLTRVLGQEHFPTDVLVGGVAGWLIGHYVTRKHQLHHSASSLRAAPASSCP